MFILVDCVSLLETISLLALLAPSGSMPNDDQRQPGILELLHLAIHTRKTVRANVYEYYMGQWI